MHHVHRLRHPRPPPPAHVPSNAGSTYDRREQGRYATLSENEAQRTGRDLQKGVPQPKGEDANGPRLSDSEAEIKCNYCFLCFRRGRKDYTVQVSFAWPNRKEARKKRGKKFPVRRIPQGSRAEVMQALQDALYQQQGRWKRWLLGYKIKDAQEITFHFDNVAENGVAPVCVSSLQATTIREAAQARLDNPPTGAAMEAGCSGSPDHTEECLDAGFYSNTTCIADAMRDATLRLHGFRMQHWLMECLQCPAKAQTRRLLEDGLLQETFVYLADQAISMPVNADQLAKSSEVRGVYVALGWDFTCVLGNIYAGGVWALFGIAIIWFGSIIWAGQTQDWSTAWAFGQVLAASVALLMYHTC